jgi:hypothetical protein
MGLDNDAFRKLVDAAAATAPKKPKPKKSKPSTKPGVGRAGKTAPAEEDDGPKYRYDPD